MSQREWRRPLTIAFTVITGGNLNGSRKSNEADRQIKAGNAATIHVPVTVFKYRLFCITICDPSQFCSIPKYLPFPNPTPDRFENLTAQDEHQNNSKVQIDQLQCSR
jgi:hypothetical protein